MTRIERLEQKLSKLKRDAISLRLDNRLTDALKVQDKIDAITKELEYIKPKPLSESLTKEQLRQSNIIPLLLATHLAADFLAEEASNVEEAMHNMGLEPRSFIPEIKKLANEAGRLAGEICFRGDFFKSLVVDNEALLVALHKKTLSYINQRTERWGKNGTKG